MGKSFILLYPYYWGNKQNWLDLYRAENTDPTFKAFLQSGMARVVATVRPGFEDAVQFYMATGKSGMEEKFLLLVMNFICRL
jgi:hypothetical protein